MHISQARALYYTEMIHIKEQVSLKLYSTMRLGGTARYVCDVTSEEDLLDALAYADKIHLPIRTIGHGSNIIWHDEGFSGLLLIMKIEGHERINTSTICFGAGVEWDAAVRVSVENGLSGLEFLSLIPGTVGATPVQNVGAYGKEIKDVILSLRAYDLHEKKFITLQKDNCDFGYRTSRFKVADSGRFIITSVTFGLSTTPPVPPFYDSLQAYFTTHPVEAYTPATIREAVIAIRSSKLPDPKQVANNGSFFANPVVHASVYEKLKQTYPDIKGWSVDAENIKIAAGWLVEKAGYGDCHDKETGMATWHAQNLVLVNEHATNTSQLITFRDNIVKTVYEKFGIALEQEPELLP
jgi:UDP-N-acetylmuramate dehydrogenase